VPYCVKLVLPADSIWELAQALLVFHGLWYNEQ